MKLNELISVIDEAVCLIAFKFKDIIYNNYSSQAGYVSIYDKSELYNVISIYTINNIIIIEVCDD